ncbi:MAG: thymidine phosphorylase [Oscillospiraceae bacterium]|nr:thymidine phosphorylase [Oscillospiraceae bacterium]
MRMYDIIQTKKQGNELSDKEIKYFVKGITDGSIPDYQISALLMAICLNGMTEHETFLLTEEMMHSGEVVDLSAFGNNTVDKHSTGGVGDKTTLIVAPIVAACGYLVPKMSGRGLGHTGGTLDKLESIPCFKTELTSSEFSSAVETCGMAVISQTANIAPADKKLYALRDVTATVDSVPLIASSVMSKKLASGAQNIVLDVTMGSGAFIKDLDSARKIAKLMVAIGKAAGRNTAAFITNMDVPLGYAIGNSLEVIEAVSLLKGEKIEDLKEVCISLAAGMIALVSNKDINTAKTIAAEALDSGRALEQFKRWINAQGGDNAFTEDFSLLPHAKLVFEYRAKSDGYIASMNTEIVGKASAVLGAGRTVQGESVDLSAGIKLLKKTGDCCHSGEVIALLYTSASERADSSSELLDAAIVFSNTAPAEQPVIYEYID